MCLGTVLAPGVSDGPAAGSGHRCTLNPKLHRVEVYLCAPLSVEDTLCHRGKGFLFINSVVRIKKSTGFINEKTAKTFSRGFDFSESHFGF